MLTRLVSLNVAAGADVVVSSLELVVFVVRDQTLEGLGPKTFFFICSLRITTQKGQTEHKRAKIKANAIMVK